MGIAEHSRERIWKIAGRVLAITAVGLLAVLATQRDQEGNRWFDMFDEGAHFDYVLRLSEGQIPKWGTQLSQETMLIETCLGDRFSTAPTDCKQKNRDPNAFAAGGYSYEAQQPPLGYLPYLPGLYLSAGLAPEETLNLVRDAGGTLLLVFACALILVIASKLRFGFWRTLLLAALMLLAPISVHAFSTVTNDGSALVAALLFVAAWLVTAKWSARGGLIAGLAVGIVLGGTKPYMLLLPGGIIASIALLTLIRQHFEKAAWLALWRRTDVRFTIGGLVTSFVVTIGFLLFQNVRAVVPSYQVLHALLGFADPVKVIQVKTVISSVSNLANNWLGPSDGLIRSSQPFFYVVNAAYLVVIGVALVRGWRSGSQPGPSVLMTTWALTTLAFSVAWPLLLFVQGHFDFDAPPRYGLLVLPLGATAAVWALARGIPEPADL